MSLYLKYRPTKFDEIVGHKNIINSIKPLLESNDPPHSYLFVGPSGTGKTTIARIIADKLGADKSEIIELNIANTTGIDFIRQLSDSAYICPMMGDSKVFILDEVHQLSKEGQNCILKLLEDSPKFTYFILCTTDPQKLIKPLKDRCQLYTLKILSDAEIHSLLLTVANLENILLPNDVMDLLIYKSDGCPRKALVYLEQIKNNTNNFEACASLLADDLEAEQDVIELAKTILNKYGKEKNKTWADLMKIYNNITVEPETIRITLANYFAGCLKNNDSEKFSRLLHIFLSPLTYGSQRSEIVFLLYCAWNEK